ncbi:MAG: LysR family transcriptional regulator [Rhizobiales bacterium]|nr:LysR family transcriptional regulator [Hyphomicrobiales bacterium]
MELHQLRCFVAAAEDLHFGNAARRLEMLPATLGRELRLLEKDLGTPLFVRTTRHVSLTSDGEAFLDEARNLVAKADALATDFRQRGRSRAATLKIGAIDTASVGLIPMLLHDFRKMHKDVAVELVEDKTIRLLPRLLSGRLDLAFVRPPERSDRRFDFEFLFHETAVAAVPSHHKLGAKKQLEIAELANEPMILPERRSRPHSHDVTIKLFAEAGLKPEIAQLAEEKQTIVKLVAARMGIAIVPKWTSQMSIAGVNYIPIKLPRRKRMETLPLAAAWVRGLRDPARDQMLSILRSKLDRYSSRA